MNKRLSIKVDSYRHLLKQDLEPDSTKKFAISIKKRIRIHFSGNTRLQT